MEDFDVCVRGAGIVGKSLALTLARQGLQVALLPECAAAAQRAGEDVRAYALNAVSIGLLQRLKVWDALPAQARGDAAVLAALSEHLGRGRRQPVATSAEEVGRWVSFARRAGLRVP